MLVHKKTLTSFFNIVLLCKTTTQREHHGAPCRKRSNGCKQGAIFMYSLKLCKYFMPHCTFLPSFSLAVTFLNLRHKFSFSPLCPPLALSFCFPLSSIPPSFFPHLLGSRFKQGMMGTGRPRLLGNGARALVPWLDSDGLSLVCVCVCVCVNMNVCVPHS